VEARLPAIHSTQVAAVLAKFVAASRRFSDFEAEVDMTVMFDEAAAQRSGLLRRQTGFPPSSEALVLSGPHFFVGNPLYKTPRSICSSNLQYDVLDLDTLPYDYLPRCNFVPELSVNLFRTRVPSLPWNEKPSTSVFRLVVSRGLSLGGERTLQPAIIIPGPCHIDGVFSIAFKDLPFMAETAGNWSSIPFDFFVKAAAKGAHINVHGSDFGRTEIDLARTISNRSPIRIRNVLRFARQNCFYRFAWLGRRGPSAPRLVTS